MIPIKKMKRNVDMHDIERGRLAAEFKKTVIINSSASAGCV